MTPDPGDEINEPDSHRRLRSSPAGWRGAAKRLFDIVFAGVGLVLLSPVLLGCAAAVRRSSPGPILFRQTRIGRHGVSFRILKFRTMKLDVESQGQLTRYNDDRITRAGRFLREWKLDELPQLWNVLVGEMSLVGPRPEVPRYVDLYTPRQRKTLRVKPGITDLASIEFRNESELLRASDDIEKTYIETILPMKLMLHEEYAARSGILFDIAIIFRTLYLILHR